MALSNPCAATTSRTQLKSSFACRWPQPCRPGTFTCRHDCLQATASRYPASNKQSSALCWHLNDMAQGCSTHSYVRFRRMIPAAGAMDGMPAWTLDQIAGLVFGALMLAAVFSAKFLDEWVACQQRKQLGLCETCGGLYDQASCTQAKCPMRNKP